MPELPDRRATPWPDESRHRRSWQRLTAALAGRWSRMLDGEYRWGALDVWPSRAGIHRYRLVVFPPGITVAEQRVLRLWRAWPTRGAVLWLIVAICLCGKPTLWAAVAIPTAVYLCVGAVTLAVARPLRSRVRTLHVLVIDGHPDPHSAAAYTELETLVTILRDADAGRDQRWLSAVDHEAACWEVYDRLAPDRLVGQRKSM
jgi:hypothetical protein